MEKGEVMHKNRGVSLIPDTGKASCTLYREGPLLRAASRPV